MPANAECNSSGSRTLIGLITSNAPNSQSRLSPSCRSPQHQDLQRLASQVLLGQTLNLQDLQKKMESQQATLAELLKMLKPAASGTNAQLLGPSSLTAPLDQQSLSIIKGWDTYRVRLCPAASAKQCPSGSSLLSKQQQWQGAAAGAIALSESLHVPGSWPPHHSSPALYVLNLLCPVQDLPALGAPPGPLAPGSSMRLRKRAAQKGARWSDTASKKERYLAIRGYWKSLPPQQRRAALQAPVNRMLDGELCLACLMLQ